MANKYLTPPFLNLESSKDWGGFRKGGVLNFLIPQCCGEKIGSSLQKKEGDKMLKGKKVILRPVKKSDVSLFLKWFNDPEVTQYLVMYLPLTEIEEKEWIEKVSRGLVVFVIEDKTKKPTKPIGNCGLRNINWKDRVAEFGIIIGEKDYWSKGFGTEAARLLMDYGFNELNLHRISSTVYEFNKRSIGLHKKLGFKEEGRRRKARFKNGKFWDEVVFGLLRREWKT